MKRIFFLKNKTVDNLFPSSELQNIEMTTSCFSDLLTEDAILSKLNIEVALEWANSHRTRNKIKMDDFIICFTPTNAWHWFRFHILKLIFRTFTLEQMWLKIRPQRTYFKVETESSETSLPNALNIYEPSIKRSREVSLWEVIVYVSSYPSQALNHIAPGVN